MQLRFTAATAPAVDGPAALYVKARLQEGRVVEDDLRRGDAQVQDAVVHGARALQRAQALLQVAVEGPQPRTAV